MSKLRTAFLEPYIDRVVDGPRGARLFCTWQQMATGTGRLSARAPNLQQVPRGITSVLGADNEAPLPVNVRSAFVASPGCVLLAADCAWPRRSSRGASAALAASASSAAPVASAL